jgi:hypothetical protein
MWLDKIQFEEKERARTSCLLTGAPGTGKSRGIEFFQRHDLRVRQGFFSIDFHAPVYRNVLTWCAANRYYDRNVILLDLSEGRFAKGVDLCKRIPGIEIGVQRSGMVDAILNAGGDKDPSSLTVVFRLLHIVLTAVLEKAIPLHECIYLLSHKDDLGRMVETFEDPLIKSLWGDISKFAPSEWSRYVAPTINRLFRLLQSKSIQRFLSLSKQGYNLELTFKDTILINLATSDKLDAYAAKTFAALWLNYCYLTSKKRKGKYGQDPPPYYGYIDEWILVPTDLYGKIAAECRKFGLLLVLANQDLSQIRESFGGSFQETILTLCQFQACFGGLNHTDASRLAREWNV